MNKLLDANAILRYLLNDTEDQATMVEKAINEGAFTIGEVVAEVVYVLQGVYKLDRNSICKSLLVLFNEIDILDKPIVKEALNEYAKSSLDYVDCLLFARAKILNESILSFDKKLNNTINKVK